VPLEYKAGKDKPDLTSEWTLYQSGIDYNNTIEYYHKTNMNWSFYNGDQWRGVPSSGLPKPVFNVIKRIINYYIASIMSRKIKGQFSIENIPDRPEGMGVELDPVEEELRQVAELLSASCELKWEKDKMDMQIREALLDGANSGDMCAYVYWDSSKETGQLAKGDFCTEIVDGGNVFFGNVNDRRVEKQPYILISGRDTVKNLKEEAKKYGINKLEIENITADENTEYQVGELGKEELENQGENAKCNYIIKFWKKDGYVWWSKSTKHVTIKKEVNLGIRKYPIAWANFEPVKNSYHGQAVATGIIPNQIYINKQFAMTMLWLMNMAYGKVIFDNTKIQSWSNQLNAAIPVSGDVSGAVQQLQPGQMNGIVMDVIDKTIQYTKDMLGANDAALGDINVDRASGVAIISTQKQASIPLENIQAAMYQFVEDIYAIWGEFILAKYTADRNVSYKENGKVNVAQFNSTPYKDLLLNVSIDIGPSTYWSEIASMQTLDGLLGNNRINMVQYLERVPQGIIPKKQELLREMKYQQEQMELQSQQQMQQQSIEQQKQQIIADNEKQAGSQLQQLQYEKMAKWLEEQPIELQNELKALPDNQYEKTVLELMNQA
jgi:hypothetical protein